MLSGSGSPRYSALPQHLGAMAHHIVISCPSSGFLRQRAGKFTGGYWRIDVVRLGRNLAGSEGGNCYATSCRTSRTSSEEPFAILVVPRVLVPLRDFTTAVLRSWRRCR